MTAVMGWVQTLVEEPAMQQPQDDAARAVGAAAVASEAPNAALAAAALH